jgi:methyl-accepting chemotaxis protein
MASALQTAIDRGVIAPSRLDRILAWLPTGGTLEEAEWAPRHRVISVVLWLHVPFIAIIGVANHQRPLEVVIDTAAIVASAALATIAPRRAAKTVFVSLGLLCSSAALVHLTGGLTEAHFHFFVMLGLVALYQEWVPYLQSVLFVLLHHALIGLVWPSAVFTTGEEQRRPILWAAIHAAFVAGQIVVQVTVWKFLELSQARKADAERAQVRALEAELQLQRSIEHREYLQDAIYKLSHWRDLDPQERAMPSP